MVLEHFGIRHRVVENDFLAVAIGSFVVCPILRQGAQWRIVIVPTQAGISEISIGGGPARHRTGGCERRHGK